MLFKTMLYALIFLAIMAWIQLFARTRVIPLRVLLYGYLLLPVPLILEYYLGAQIGRGLLGYDTENLIGVLTISLLIVVTGLTMIVKWKPRLKHW